MKKVGRFLHQTSQKLSSNFLVKFPSKFGSFFVGERVAGEAKPWTYNRDRRFDVTDLWRQLNHVPSSVHHPSPMIGSSSPPFSSVSTWVSQTLPSVPNAQMQKTINGHTFGDLYSTEDKTPIELAITHARIMLICFLFSLAFSCVNRPPPKKSNGGKPSQKHWLVVLMRLMHLSSFIRKSMGVD